MPTEPTWEDTISMLDERPLRTHAGDRDDRSMQLFEAALAVVAMIGAVLLAFVR